jgi:hypothetical protein
VRANANPSTGVPATLLLAVSSYRSGRVCEKQGCGASRETKQSEMMTLRMWCKEPHSGRHKTRRMWNTVIRPVWYSFTQHREQTGTPRRQHATGSGHASAGIGTLKCPRAHAFSTISRPGFKMPRRFGECYPNARANVVAVRRIHVVVLEQIGKLSRQVVGRRADILARVVAAFPCLAGGRRCGVGEPTAQRAICAVHSAGGVESRWVRTWCFHNGGILHITDLCDCYLGRASGARNVFDAVGPSDSKVSDRRRWCR